MQPSENSSDSKFQSTLSVRRATYGDQNYLVCTKISIHALRKESDLMCEATSLSMSAISIHALRKESDYLVIE